MSAGWLVQVKRIRGKKLPLTAARVHALWDEYTLLANLAAEWTRPALSTMYKENHTQGRAREDARPPGGDVVDASGQPSSSGDVSSGRNQLRAGRASPACALRL
jgi:hypothetical protein